MKTTKATGWRPIVQDWRYRQSERGGTNLNVYMMPQEPGQAVSTSDFKESSEEALIEQLADKEHASWARWMIYLFSRCPRFPDGSMVIPAEYVKRWKQQAYTPYEKLSEQEKQSDRDEVAHILPIIRQQDGILQGGDMLWLRRMLDEKLQQHESSIRAIIREELAQSVERFFARGLDNLMTAIKAPPHDEMEEIAAILATLAPEELEAIIAKVRERTS